MIEFLPILATSFLAGLLGSAHCLGMCGGLSGLFAVSATVASLRSQLPLALAYNLGRILSYTFLGTVVAVIGRTTVDAIPALAGPVRLASGAVIIIIGLQVMFGWRVLAALENMGAVLWKRLAPIAKGMIPATTPSKAAGLGLIWGWLPCGLVYSVLLISATMTSPLHGGLVMLAFGLGTMPAMVMSGLGASKMSALMSRHRLSAGLLIVILGIATLAMPVMGLFGASPHAGHAGHSAHSAKTT